MTKITDETTTKEIPNTLTTIEVNPKKRGRKSKKELL